MITLHEPTTEVRILNPKDAEYYENSYLVCEEFGPWLVSHTIVYAEHEQEALDLFLDVYTSSKIDEIDLGDYADENGEIEAYWHDELHWCDISGIHIEETDHSRLIGIVR